MTEGDTGYITGTVYTDVNGDGQCIGTDVEGEGPIEGVTIEFVSSDEATVVTLTTADDGTYGLADAGESYWRVSAKPDPATHVVTSENPLYAPVFPADGMVQTGYDFCVSDGTTAEQHERGYYFARIWRCSYRFLLVEIARLFG